MAHVVPGLLRAGKPPKVLLSARNQARSAALAERFGLEVCSRTADLIERSDIVIVAVRPFDVEKTIVGLP